MRVHWNQLSPSEKQALVRHYVLHKPDAPVNPETIWREMQKTHFLSCISDQNGSSVVGFGAAEPGTRAGVAVCTDLADGIYRAALRANGVELQDEAPGQPRSARRAAR